MADMAIVRSPHFYAWKVGGLTIKRENAYGAKKDCTCPTGIRSDGSFIITTVQKKDIKSKEEIIKMM